MYLLSSSDKPFAVSLKVTTTLSSPTPLDLQRNNMLLSIESFPMVMSPWDSFLHSSIELSCKLCFARKVPCWWRFDKGNSRFPLGVWTRQTAAHYKLKPFSSRRWRFHLRFCRYDILKKFQLRESINILLPKQIKGISKSEGCL